MNKRHLFVYVIVGLAISEPSLAADSLPWIELPEAEVCKGITYIHPVDMLPKTGSKACLASVEAIHCTPQQTTACVVKAPERAVMAGSLKPAKIRGGVSILGVTGTMDASQYNPPCTKHNQTNCQVGLPFRAAKLTNLSSNDVKSGHTVLGVQGSFTDPDPTPDCSPTLTKGCFATGKYMAVQTDQLTAGNIKNGESIGTVKGLFPSASYPLDTMHPGRPGLAATNLTTLIKQANPFHFFDRTGKQHHVTGSADFVAAKFAQGKAVFGVTGTAKGQALPDYGQIRHASGLYEGKGKLKLDCRDAFAAGHNTATPYPTIDDSGTAKATNYKWGAAHNCNEELWQNVTKNAGGEVIPCTAANPNCVYQDIVTGLKWRKDGDRSKTSRDAAAAKCEAIPVTDGKKWRLPTSKEALQAYVHRIRYVAQDANFLAATERYWLSSKRPADDSSYSIVEMYAEFHTGIINGGTTAKGSFNTLCVK